MPASLDPTAFARLFQEHARALWCIAAAVLGDRERARDVVQDSAIIGLERLSEFHVGTSFQSWMGQIVRYTALNELRKGKLRKTAGNEPLAFVAGDSNSSTGEGVGRSGVSRAGTLSPDQAAFDDATAAALQHLDETARACLLMRTVLDMSYDQIAQALAIPPGTAMSHVHRSRQKLRTLLTQRQSGQQSGHQTGHQTGQKSGQEIQVSEDGYRTINQPARERGSRDI